MFHPNRIARADRSPSPMSASVGGRLRRLLPVLITQAGRVEALGLFAESWDYPTTRTSNEVMSDEVNPNAK